MAQVDFSSAVLDVKTNSKPLTMDTYMMLGFGGRLDDANGNAAVGNYTQTTLASTASKITFLYKGKFIKSGTELFFNQGGFRISNISFEIGDTYSFAIEIEVGSNA